MSSEEEKKVDEAFVSVRSSRFGELSVPAETIIDFPHGMIGFPEHRKFVMFEHKAPFAWLHSTEDPDLAFVVIDGSKLCHLFDFKAPFGDKEIELKEDDEFAILVVVTVRSDPKLTTANVKAPLFVNLRTRKGLQIIHDDPKFPTRFPIWSEGNKEVGNKEDGEAK